MTPWPNPLGSATGLAHRQLRWGLQLVQFGLQIAAASTATTGITARPLHANETEAKVNRRLGPAGLAQPSEGVQRLQGNLSLMVYRLCLCHQSYLQRQWHFQLRLQLTPRIPEPSRVHITYSIYTPI
jgi:hypothetical protein